MSYVYIESECFTDGDGMRHQLFTVGFYKPDGSFESDSDHSSRDAAGDRVNYLNGGMHSEIAYSIKALCENVYEYGIMVQSRG